LASKLVHGGAGVAALGEERSGELEQLALAHVPGDPAVPVVLDALAFRCRPGPHLPAVGYRE